ncbi:flagellin [Alphaproteobacteria bacterium]|nr:flagellin [Alphaproteobacteria bacterium]
MATGVSTLGQALARIDRINVQQTQLNDLSTQLATGKKTQKFSGLGTDVLTSKRARADFQSLDVYKNNIKNASRRISLMLNAVKEFQEQTRNFLGSINLVAQQADHEANGVNILSYDDPTTPNVIETTKIGVDSAEMSVDFQSMTSLASTVYDFLETLLNVQDGDRYLLSGAETSTEPFTDTGTLDAAISSQISDWKAGTVSTDQIIQNLNDRDASTNPGAVTDSIIGYSAPLSSANAGNIFVRADDNLEVEYTTLANEEPFRDIMVAVSYFKNENLPPISDVYEPPNVPTPPFSPDIQGAPGADNQEKQENFFQVLNTLSGVVNNALDQLDLVVFKLSSAQGRITELGIQHSEEQNLLQGVISDVEDADQNEVALKLNTILTQLEASYAVTSRVQQLSLVNYI